MWQESDEIYKERVKVIHTQGVVAKVKYVPEPNNGLSGMLGVESDTVLLRFSEQNNLHEESEGLTPSVGIKWLRDGKKSENIVAQVSFKNTGSWNFFKEPLKTRIEGFDPVEDKLWIETLQRKNFDGTTKPFFMGVSEVYANNLDGTAVADEEIGWIPYQLEFESQYQFPDFKTDTPWYEQLTSITDDSDTPLLEVYALTAPLQKLGERVKIGKIQLMSELTTSKFGDERLYFQHIAGFKDTKRYPWSWSKYDIKRSSEDSGWGNIVPNTWPKTDAEAKSKFME